MKLGKQASSVICISVAVVLAALMMFLRLGHLPIHLWDESRLATNAFEMYRTGFSWVTTFHYRPDTWNTKPPLLIWLQCFSLKLFGVNEVAIRLPSAIAGVLTCFVIAWFCSRKLKDDWLAIVSVVILCTCDGFVKVDHCVRTGDYDALLTFFTTCSMLSFYLFIEEGKRNYLVAAFFAFALAILTKGVAALVFAPAIFLFVLYRRKLLFFFKEPVFYISFAGFCMVVIGYYLVREHYDPGYFNWVKMNELGGRFLEKGMNANHPDETWFYLDLVTGRNFSFWWMLLVLGVVVSFFTKKRLIKSFSLFAAFSAILFLVIISCSKSKSEWYDAPVYPFFAIVAGVGVMFLFNLTTRIKPDIRLVRMVFAGIIAFFFVAKPYKEKLENVYSSGLGDWAVENTRMSTYLREKMHQNNVSSLIIVRDTNYQANIDWYQEVININAGCTVVRTVTAHTLPTQLLQVGDTVAVYQDAEKQLVASQYNVVKTGDTGGVSFYRINTSK